jgi:hypothetical protein
MDRAMIDRRAIAAPAFVDDPMARRDGPPGFFCARRYEFAANYAFIHTPRNAEPFPFRDVFCRIDQWRQSA